MFKMSLLEQDVEKVTLNLDKDSAKETLAGVAKEKSSEVAKEKSSEVAKESSSKPVLENGLNAKKPAPSPPSSTSKKPSAPLYVPPRARSKSPEEEWVKSTKSNQPQDEDDWDSMYDDSGNCIKPELVQEFKTSVGIKPEKRVIVQQVKCDTLNGSLNHSLNHSTHPHVLELYDFDPELKESDIAMRISSLG